MRKDKKNKNKKAYTVILTKPENFRGETLKRVENQAAARDF